MLDKLKQPGGLTYSESSDRYIPGTKNKYSITRGGSDKSDKYFLNLSNTKFRFIDIARLDKYGNIEKVENLSDDEEVDRARVNRVIGEMLKKYE